MKIIINNRNRVILETKKEKFLTDFDCVFIYVYIFIIIYMGELKNLYKTVL